MTFRHRIDNTTNNDTGRNLYDTDPWSWKALHFAACSNYPHDSGCQSMGFTFEPIEYDETFRGMVPITTIDGICYVPKTTTQDFLLLHSNSYYLCEDYVWMVQCEDTTAFGGQLPYWLSLCEYSGWQLDRPNDGPLVTKSIRTFDGSNCTVTKPDNWIGWEELTKELQQEDPRTFHRDPIPEGTTKCEYLHFTHDTPGN